LQSWNDRQLPPWVKSGDEEPDRGSKPSRKPNDNGKRKANRKANGYQISGSSYEGVGNSTSFSLARARERETTAISPAFDEAWKVCPKKNGKRPALDAWFKRGLTEDDLPRILAAIEYMKSEAVPFRDEYGDPDFTRCPSFDRWLKEERDLDYEEAHPQ
jgi:hypothetical protein